MKSLKNNLFTSPIACIEQAAASQLRWMQGLVYRFDRDGVDSGIVNTKELESNIDKHTALGTLGSLPKSMVYHIPSC